MPAAIQLSMIEPDIALLTLDQPGKSANILSRHVLDELAAHLDALLPRKDLAGLILASAKPGIFIAGADLREFAAAGNITKAETIKIATRGRTLFQRLRSCPFVTVAAIDGVCVGGGAELAVWCDRRVMSGRPSSSAQIGFPEVKLGMFPGWGGTAVAPRLVGLANAVELITGGESIDGAAAYAMGLVDDLVPAGQVVPAAVGLVRAEQQTRGYEKSRARLAEPIHMSETELGFLGATASAYIQQQTKGHYPAPLAALELLLEAASLPLEDACRREAESFAELFGTPINRALINVFFLNDRNKRDPGVEKPVASPRPIKSVGVIGAGIMGSGITAAVVKRDLPVTITDAAAPALAAGVRRVLEEASYNKATKGPDVERMAKIAPLVNATSTEAEFSACDLIIEAVVENPSVKRELFSRLVKTIQPDAILASNTSAISIGTLAEGLPRPERFLGIHFFNPVRQMPLVEVIRGPKTGDDAVAAAVAFAKRLGKSPIVVRDGAGFLVNRLLLPYMTEALELLREGVPIKAVEKAARSFGLPMGPITLYDVVGLDTALYAGRVMQEAFPDRVIGSPILEALVAAGRLGQKTGAGFYSYSGKKGKGVADPKLDNLLKPLIQPGSRNSDEQLIDRMILPMVVEAARIISEGVVRDVRDVDLGLIYGIGFPPFRGGLLYWADHVGLSEIVRRLTPWIPLGKRYEPPELLLDLAGKGRKFYDLAESAS